jgi:hypothetical protein
VVEATSFDAAVRLTAAAVLLHEGVEGAIKSDIVLLDHLIRPLQERRRDREAQE